MLVGAGELGAGEDVLVEGGAHGDAFDDRLPQGAPGAGGAPFTRNIPRAAETAAPGRGASGVS